MVFHRYYSVCMYVQLRRKAGRNSISQLRTNMLASNFPYYHHYYAWTKKDIIGVRTIIFHISTFIPDRMIIPLRLALAFHRVPPQVLPLHWRTYHSLCPICTRSMFGSRSHHAKRRSHRNPAHPTNTQHRSVSSPESVWDHKGSVDDDCR